MTRSKGFAADPDGLSLQSQLDNSSGSNDSAVVHRSLVDIDDDAPELSIDDLPPLYSEIDTESSAHDANGSEPLLAASSGDITAIQVATLHEASTKGEGRPVRSMVYPDTREYPNMMFYQLNAEWVRQPPRPFIQLRGTHTETVERDGKKETPRIVDFDVKVDLTPYLYSDARQKKGWCVIETAGKFSRVRRGTVFRCQDPSAKAFLAAGHLRPDLEQVGDDGEGEEGVVFQGERSISLQRWCQRYYEDRSTLKCFSLERKLVGFDYESVRKQMELLVRRTNYRGHLSVKFPTNEVRLDIYNDHWMNRWRLLRWLRILCSVSLLIVFTWPFLFFRTKRYEVVTSYWYFSRPDANHHKEYVSLSEDQLYNLWGRAITQAVLAKRQTVLDQEDLRAAEGAGPTFESGNATVNNAVNFVQAGINAMNHVNQQLGWGGDS